MAPDTLNLCSAEFTLNGQYGNQKVAPGATVTLQAVNTQATTYRWEVFSDPLGCAHQLLGGNQPQATFIPQDVGVYIIQLSVSKDECHAVTRNLLWTTTAQRKYRLPATGEPLRFTGDEEWAGDLVQV